MASKEFLVNIDLNQQRLLNAALQIVPVFPSNPVVGQIVWNSSENLSLGGAFVYTGVKWVDLGDVYTHPSFSGTGQPSAPLTGANVISKITLNNGHVTGVETRAITPADIGASTAIHTHAFSQITGLPPNTILGNNTGTEGVAKALTVGEMLTLLGFAYGTLTILNTGTDTTQRTWTAADLKAYVTSRLSTYLSLVDLTLTKTITDNTISNSAGSGVTLTPATITLAGLLSASDKSKLDGIESGANKYIHSTQNPGVHPFATEQINGLRVLSQIVVSNEGHVTSIKSRDLTAADMAYVLINDNTNTATSQTWSASKIYNELQAAIVEVSTGALVYKGEYNPLTATPNLTTLTTIKAGWTYVVSATGTFLGQAVEAGDMIIATTNNPGSNIANYQLVNKNIPAIVSATTVVEGILKLAEMQDYIDNNATKAVTPALLKAILNARVGGAYATFGDGSSTNFTINHPLDTRDVIIQTRRVSTKAEVVTAWAATANDTITVGVNIAPQNNELEIIIKK